MHAAVAPGSVSNPQVTVARDPAVALVAEAVTRGVSGAVASYR